MTARMQQNHYPNGARGDSFSPPSVPITTQKSNSAGEIQNWPVNSKVKLFHWAHHQLATKVSLGGNQAHHFDPFPTHSITTRKRDL